MTPQYEWPRSADVIATRWFVRLAARLVPARDLARVVEEWEAELWVLVTSNRARGGSNTVRRTLAFCRGIVPYVLWASRHPSKTSQPRRKSHGMNTLAQDIRYGARSFARNPTFTAAVILTLALGIGASTTVFSVVNGVLLRPLPYPHPDRLVMVGITIPGFGDMNAMPPGVFEEWRLNDTALNPMVAFSWWTLDLTGDGQPDRVGAAGVSAGFFPLLGVTPILGRGFLPEEDEPNTARVAVLSHRLWRTRWGGAADILGQTVSLSGEPFTVIGVLPPDFHYPEALSGGNIDILYPYRQHIPTGDMIQVLGRLEDGVSIDEAQQTMNAMGGQTAARGIGSSLTPLEARTLGNVAPTLKLLFGAVGFLLLIACANVANLLLARSTDRQREMALRTALGAGRGRIARQLFTESMMLALAGGAVGVLLTTGGVRALVAFTSGSIPRLAEVTMDTSVMTFVFVVAVVTGILFGLAPVVQLAADIQGGLRSGSTGTTTTKGGRRLRASFVVAQMALALMLLVGAGLLIQSFVRLSNVDPGFDSENVAFASIILPPGYESREQQQAFFSSVLERVESSVPGLEAAGLATNPPMSGDSWRSRIVVDGFMPPPDFPMTMDYSHVSADYFKAIGMELIAGRRFTERDRAGAESVIVVNESFARQFWPNGNAIGGRLKRGRSADSPGPWYTVIGVVNDVKQHGLAETGIPETYLSFRQVPSDQMSVVVRSTAGFAAVAGALQRAVWDVDPNIPTDVNSMEGRIAGTIAAPRFYTVLLSSFAAVALILASVGIYGTMAYTVGERTQEVGLRIALGAATTSVLKLVVRQGMTLAVIGAGVGVAGAMGTARLLESMLFGVEALDITAFLSAVALLLGIALLACYLPARRATRIDPMIALRAE